MRASRVASLAVLFIAGSCSGFGGPKCALPSGGGRFQLWRPRRDEAFGSVRLFFPPSPADPDVCPANELQQCPRGFVRAGFPVRIPKILRAVLPWRGLPAWSDRTPR